MITPAYAPTATERVLPRMALDFTTGVLDSRVTIARALNTATRVNSSGFVEAVNANLPRFDYDPVTLAPKGLLIEESRTNLLTYSEQFENVAWTKNATTVTTNSTASPSGAITADTLQATAGTGLTPRVADVSVLTVNGAAHTASMYVKAGTYTFFQIYLSSQAGEWANFTLTGAGSASANGASTATIQAVGGGWYRIAMTYTAGGTDRRPFFMMAASASATRGQTWNPVGTETVFIWGAQLEVGAFATSYIPTTTTSLTRNADAVSMTGTNFSSWYNATEGAFLFQFTPDLNLVSNINRVANVSQGGATGRVADIYTSGGFWTMYNGTTAFVTGASVVTSVSQKITAAYKASSYALTLNGVAPTTNNSALLNTANQMAIGSFGGSNYLNGHMQKILYWPQRIINAETQAFSKQ